MISKTRDIPACDCIPKLDALLRASRRDQVAVGRENDRVDGRVEIDAFPKGVLILGPFRE